MSQHTAFSKRMWVDYTKGGENIVAISCRFTGTVPPVNLYTRTKVSEAHIATFLRLDWFSVTPQRDVIFLPNVGSCVISYGVSLPTKP
jgi:hypothetical protein